MVAREVRRGFPHPYRGISEERISAAGLASIPARWSRFLIRQCDDLANKVLDFSGSFRSPRFKFPIQRARDCGHWRTIGFRKRPVNVVTNEEQPLTRFLQFFCQSLTTACGCDGKLAS